MAGVIHSESKGLHGKFASLQTSRTAEVIKNNGYFQKLCFVNFISNLFIPISVIKLELIQARTIPTVL